MARWTIARQEACLSRGLSSAMGSMLDRADRYSITRKQAKANVDDVIAKILLGSVPDRAKAEDTLRKILGA